MSATQSGSPEKSTSPNKKLIGIIVAAAVVLLGGGGSIAAIIGQQNGDVQTTPTPGPPSATATLTPTPTPTPTVAPVTPVELPYSVPVGGAIDGWSAASPLRIATVSAQVGNAADGMVSAYIDAPVVDTPGEVLASMVKVGAGATYTFSAEVRQLSELPEPVSAHLVVAGTKIPLPELSAAWTTVTERITIPAGMTEAKIAVELDGPVTGLGLDAVSLTGSDGRNIAYNPSFETVAADRGILNKALILRQRSATLGVNLAPGPANWTLTRGDGSVAAQGAVDLVDGPSAVPLLGAPQGYFTATVTDSAGASVSTTLGLVDYADARPVADERIGAITHVDQFWYEDAANTLAAVGFGSARNDVLWELNERTRGVYDFEQHYIAEFGKMHAHGVGLLGIVNYANPLYDAGLTPNSPDAVNAYGAYAAAIAKSFDVVGLEVFNEFNHDRFNNGGCGSAPPCYVPLVTSVEQHVDATGKQIPIVIGSTANYDAEWFDGLWQTEAINHADAMSFHPYNPTFYQNPEKLTSVIATANRSMQDHAGKTLPIWITEFGWTTGNELGQAVSTDEQARRLVVAQTTALVNGAQKYYWYDMIDDSTDPNNHEGNFGMFYRSTDSVAAPRPKAAGYAQALLISKIAGRPVAAAPDAVPAGTTSILFGTDDDGVRVAWSHTPGATLSYRTTKPLTVTDLVGNVTVIQPQQGIVTVPVGEWPVIIAGDFAELPTAPATPTPSVSPDITAKPEDDN